jgi:branched-chain amino acid transport system ATP-binding protein
MSELLSLERVSAGYGAARVLEDIDLSIEEGQSLALLGRNGVGKSTLIMTLMGLTEQHRGSIRFAGSTLNGMAVDRRARSGLGWVPQERLIFPSLSVRQNIEAVARPGKWNLKRVWQMFPRLEERAGNGGSQLSGGEQQMLAMARALVTNPRLLLLDEPMEGLAPIIVEELARAITALVKSDGLTVILVEQHARLALRLTQQAVVLDRGRIVHRDQSARLRGDHDLLARLLGVREG